MHLAILVTNTDLSDFAHRHPFDGEKFTTLMQSVRPGWTCSIFDVHQDAFPQDVQAFDGLIITGSPASVHDENGWGARLATLIREAHDRQQPIFGACYGHQAIALALGGQVERNPQGWEFGLVRSDIVSAKPWMAALGSGHQQFSAHTEQVTRLPENAEVVTRSARVPVGGFSVGTHIFTSQNHPEMTRAFFDALLEEYSETLGPDLARHAQMSLEQADDYAAYAECIAAFFEQAVN